MRFLFGFILYHFAVSALALDCNKAITTPEINQCAKFDQDKVEARLNKVYQRVLKTLDKPDTEIEHYSKMKESLIAAQRSWVKFRQADCDAAFEKSASGTIRTVMYIGCMQARAEQRIKELEIYNDQ